jgi:hypothetical protein
MLFSVPVVGVRIFPRDISFDGARVVVAASGIAGGPWWIFHDFNNPEPHRSLRDEGSAARLSAMAKRRAALPAATVMIDPK